MKILDNHDRTTRPPVVAVMGHIDHGKSTLLDYIRKSNVAEGEAGGITQHVSAYEVTHKKEGGEEARITFLDTPGHEAFKGIRSRGASLADIAVLVVSAEDGVKPQTIEAYKRIKESETPFIVAITKIDKQSANIDRTKQSLAENDILVEGYGGDVPTVALSAKTGEGVDDLIDLIFLLADLENFTGDETKWGTGVIVESRLDTKVGIIAVGIIKDGTVKKGMYAASIGAVATLRFIEDIDGNQVDELSFSSPVLLTGWDNVPHVGSVFEIFEDKKAAQLYAESESVKYEVEKRDAPREDVDTVPFIIKADAAGSLEAIQYEISKLSRERIEPVIVLAGVGTISENDIKTAMATAGTLVFAFNTKADAQADSLAERSGIPIENFNIIYKLTERIKEILEEKEPKIEVDEVVGTCKVLKIFSETKDARLIGARITSGSLEVGAEIRISKDEEEKGRGHIRELQQNKVGTDKISDGEFGAMIETRTEVSPGDTIEAINKVIK
jgi:translation initiation factor IF-2